MSTGTRLPIGEPHDVLDEILAVDPIYLTAAESGPRVWGWPEQERDSKPSEAAGDRTAATWPAKETREAQGPYAATRCSPQRWRPATPTWLTRSGVVR